MARVFISYSRKNEAFARQLAAALSAAGADVWIDIEDIAVGHKWSKAIQAGLDIAEVMLVIISPDSMTSSNVEDEWQYFLDNKKPVIPILHLPAKIHFQLNRIQYVDFHNQPFETAFEILRAQLAIQGVQLAHSNMATVPARPVHTSSNVAPPQMSWRTYALVGGALVGVLVLGLIVMLVMNRGDDPAKVSEDFLQALADSNFGIASELVCSDVRDQIQVGQLWSQSMTEISCQADLARENWVVCNFKINNEPFTTEFRIDSDNKICGGSY